MLYQPTQYIGFPLNHSCYRQNLFLKNLNKLFLENVNEVHTCLTLNNNTKRYKIKQSKTKEGKIKQIKIKECKTKRNKQKKRNETKESKTKQTNKQKQSNTNVIYNSGRHGRDRMVVGFTTTCAISAYHH
jgi:predicted fused transcriptional regulator/phosphomethylpyrimidine kinase